MNKFDNIINNLKGGFYNDYLIIDGKFISGDGYSPHFELKVYSLDAKIKTSLMVDYLGPILAAIKNHTDNIDEFISIHQLLHKE